jgi:hypothetical protein
MRLTKTLLCLPLALLCLPALAQEIKLAKTAFLPSETIGVDYQIEKPSEGLYIVNIVTPKDPDSGLDNYKYVREYPQGHLDLYGKVWEGNYELRLLRYKSTADVNPVVVKRLAFTVSKKAEAKASTETKTDNTKTNTTTRNCNTKVPASVGAKPKGAPAAKEITTILRGVLAERNAPRWLEGKDLCVEFGTIRYLPKSKVKLFSDWNNPAQAALPAWPVRVKVTITIPKGAETEVKIIDNPKEAFFFYKDDKGKWNFKAGSHK